MEFLIAACVLVSEMNFTDESSESIIRRLPPKHHTTGCSFTSRQTTELSQTDGNTVSYAERSRRDVESKSVSLKYTVYGYVSIHPRRGRCHGPRDIWTRWTDCSRSSETFIPYGLDGHRIAVADKIWNRISHREMDVSVFGG